MAAGASGARNEFGKNEIPGTAGGKPAAVRPVVSDRSEAELFQVLQAKDVAARALEAGLVVNAVTENALRLAPSLLVSDDEIDECASILGSVLSA